MGFGKLFGGGRKKPAEKKNYDRSTQKPVIRCSICTGEQVAGFRNLQTGKFEEVMLIQDRDDLEYFMKVYGIDSIDKEY